MVGLGYVPDNSPPAVPSGGNEVGITPAASFAEVTEASIIFEVDTELSASFEVVITPVPMVGLGYVPDNSPPAVPSGGNEVGITPAASFAEVTEASIIFEVDTELSASLPLVIASFVMVGFG